MKLRVNRAVTAALLLVVAIAAAGIGYWWGTKGTRAGAPTPGSETAPAERRVLYYRHPMGLPDTSPVPKKMPDGMAYIPVYEGDAADAASGIVTISPDKVQNLGVKTAAAELRELVRPLHAVAIVHADERRLHTVAPRFEGWIQTLHINTTGQTVASGQALMDVYSPDLITAQEEYLIALRGLAASSGGSPDTRARMQHLVDSALQRLRNWDIAEAELRQLQTERTVRQNVTLRAPVSGVVLEKPSIAGQRFMPGDVLFQIADLSNVWLLADIFEQDLAMVRVGQMAEIQVDAYPGRLFTGRVTFIYPTIRPETRTATVRMELANTAGLLKPAMYAQADFAAPKSPETVLTVPVSAVLDTGSRQVVLVQRGEGRFEPRQVRLGPQAGGFVEVLEGVNVGDNVVVSANFLIDAESNLKAALGAFGDQANAKGAVAEPAANQGH
jgi:Cu(I)/Ag(I) efflux system membrane fusion protein